MGVPGKLLDFTSPIVETALKTGARGSTSTTTNYGVIGDAMFKKSQVDLGIANLQADMGFKAASIKSGLEMQKAGMNMDMARTYMDQNLKLRDLQMQLKENEVGFFEGFLNVAAGAVGAASIALTAGASTPLVVGAAAAGGLATAGAQAEDGRRGARGALGAIGMISEGAQLIKQTQSQRSAEDAVKGWADTAIGLAGVIGNPKFSPAQQSDAMIKLEQHTGQLASNLISEGVNPQIAIETAQNLRSIYAGGGSGRGSAKGAGGKSTPWEDYMLQKAFETKANPEFQDPAKAKGAMKKLLADTEMAWAGMHSGQEMTENQQKYFVESLGIDPATGMMGMNQGSNKPAPTQRQLAHKEEVSPASLAQDVTQQLKNPRKGSPIKQAPQQHTTPDGLVIERIPAQAQAIRAQGPGVEMDQPSITSPEAVEPLAKIGAESAGLFRKAHAGEGEQAGVAAPSPGLKGVEGKIDTAKERLLHGGMVNIPIPLIGGDVMLPGLLTSAGAQQDKLEKGEEFDFNREALNTVMTAASFLGVGGLIKGGATTIGKGALKKVGDQLIAQGAKQVSGKAASITAKETAKLATETGKLAKLMANPSRAKPVVEAIKAQTASVEAAKRAVELTKAGEGGTTLAGKATKAAGKFLSSKAAPVAAGTAVAAGAYKLGDKIGMDVNSEKDFVEAKKERRNWDQEIRDTKPPEEQPYFTETDVRKIQDAYNLKDKKFTPDEKSKVEGSTAAAVQLNKLRKELEALWDEKGLTHDVLMDYQFWKSGVIGEEGLTGKGVQAGALGAGVAFQKFEKSVRQSLEGKGVKGEAANRIIQKIKSIDAKVDPLAQSLAVAKQGARPSDRDVSGYKDHIVNMLDPNPDNSIAGLISLQELIYTDFDSLLYNTLSVKDALRRSGQESEAKRMSIDEVIERANAKEDARKNKRGKAKSYYFD